MEERKIGVFGTFMILLVVVLVVLFGNELLDNPFDGENPMDDLVSGETANVKCVGVEMECEVIEAGVALCRWEAEYKND
jgi:hypothetical protein